MRPTPFMHILPLCRSALSRSLNGDRQSCSAARRQVNVYRKAFVEKLFAGRIDMFENWFAAIVCTCFAEDQLQPSVTCFQRGHRARSFSGEPAQAGYLQATRTSRIS